MRVSIKEDGSGVRAVRLWLFAVAAMIVLTLVVGGATRMTESGLSIVEWKPVTGVLPPFSESEWQSEFMKYQAIPQYRELNRGMSLDAFKVIYWWEWSHRLLARLTGAVFLIPFLFFLWRGAIPVRLRTRLWTIFAAGAALGVVGWWMVSSGLAGSGRVSVSQYRLSFHLTLACAIYAAVLWTAQSMARRFSDEPPRNLRNGSLAIVLLVLLQIYVGALVAGLDAGLVYNTWPLIDGSFVPEAERLWFLEPGWRNLFENTLTVQFEHRMLAYAIWLIVMLHAWSAWEARRGVVTALLLAAVLSLQALLGIVTLLYQAPIPLALAHQILAILTLTIAVVHAEALAGAKTVQVSTADAAKQGT
ncbi:MAG TPA: COX15/CtaA family protein [Pseudolabrys sp.]|nr:COX15/CtaA family protein [Pseudolabrys sp.]